MLSLDAIKVGGDGVTVWDGRVIFAPNASAAVGVFEPATNAFTLVPIGAVVEFEGGALANDGRVVFAPAAGHSLVGVVAPGAGSFESVVSETTTAETIAFGASRPFVGAARLVPQFLGVRVHQIFEGRHAVPLQVQPPEARERPGDEGRDLVGHAQVRDVRERVAQCRELPIENSPDAAVFIIDQVVAAKVAVRHT